jgi:Cofactor assembly of complex C subunit B, CCB2/CCB4
MIMNRAKGTSILRYLPLSVGILGGLLLMVNRLTTVSITDSQARGDAIAIIESAILILVTILWQQVQSLPPESVILIGQEGLELEETLPENIKNELAWASRLILTNTVTRSLAIYYQGKTILRRGILGKNSQVNPGAIVKRVLETGKPVYLVDLKLYPGKIEFDYLPENTQGIICQPLAKNGVLILGANAPRSYTKKDENWIEGIADKLSETLSKGMC